MSIVDEIRVIDTDTHLVEPPDLWTSRMASKWADMAPRVRWDDEHEEEAWFIGAERVTSVGGAAQAGWREFPPDHPPRWEDADPATWDPVARAARMDADGIHAQVLYPNVAMFNSDTVQGAVRDAGFQLGMIQAYNDYQTDFAAAAPGRFVPVTSLPFWDLEATLDEIERCAAMGHRGIVFSQAPSAFGLPELTDPFWDPMWRSAEEKGLPVNFHIASGDMSIMHNAGHPDNGAHANYASLGVQFFMGNARTVAQIICGGICHRFPELNFVSVESGIGWIPFALASLDWQWLNCGVPKEHPEYDLLPSEYFRRQIYGCFWFERATAMSAIDQLGPDNVLYETDFPHPTSMSPGPASAAVSPRQYIDETFGPLPDDVVRKVLHDNAARIYHLD